jgi:hypothetical protein
MMRAATLFALCAMLSAKQALACFPDPAAKPKVEVSELRLAGRPSGPAVIYSVGRYAIYMKPQDLLLAIQGQGSGEFAVDTFPGQLSKRLPLQSDVEIEEILAALVPEVPSESDRSEEALQARRLRREVQRQIGFGIAELLESERAAVIEARSGEVVPMIRRYERSTVCSGGREFVTPDGAVVLSTSDWVG